MSENQIAFAFSSRKFYLPSARFTMCHWACAVARAFFFRCGRFFLHFCVFCHRRLLCGHYIMCLRLLQYLFAFLRLTSLVRAASCFQCLSSRSFTNDILAKLLRLCYTVNTAQIYIAITAAVRFFAFRGKRCGGNYGNYVRCVWV